MAQTLEDEVAWCRRHFDMIALNGVWVVPRSGLVFKKIHGQALELVLVMPWTDEMKSAAAEGKDVPKTQEELVAYQRADFDAIEKRFKLAGITMTGRERIE